MTNTQHIADQIGQRQIATALGVGTTAVSNAVVRGSFPTSWFLVVKRLCDERGVDCPETAFNFKLPSDDARVSCLSDSHGPAPAPDQEAL